MTFIKKPKRDFGTLRTERIADDNRQRLATHISDPVEELAGLVLETFDDYYSRSRDIPWLAKEAFETRNWQKAIDLSQERIAIYSVSIDKICPYLREFIDHYQNSSQFWDQIEQAFQEKTAERYERELAQAYLTSVRRALHNTYWRPDWHQGEERRAPPHHLIKVLRAPGRMTPGLVEDILAIPGLAAPFKDIGSDAEIVSERINSELIIGGSRPLEHIEIINAGFYRNRGAYIVGALQVAGDRSPLALALLNRNEGIEVDAVILRRTTLSHIFSSTLANFHVTLPDYHELVDYLHDLMPSRPRSEHYSTIGYNHVGKIAIMNQITQGLEESGQGLDHAPGPRGSVALGFTAPRVPFVLKVIRDKPTDQYKWNSFGGVESILKKYSSVHELNRSGSMLDNVIYSDLLLSATMFEKHFLEEMLQSAPKSVSRKGEHILFQHLIVQRKLIPIPLYLQKCSALEAETVVIRLGQCIRNNAATNVFNKDLDGRNYGVSPLRFVYLFDYDAVESLTDVKVRTNLDREEYEEDIPDWFFEEGEIFLPEELEVHLRLPDKRLRRLFREAHGELLTLEYWERMQAWLKEGRVPSVRTYPRSTQLKHQTYRNLTLARP